MKTRLTRNLQIGFGVSLLILICTSTASYISIQNLFKSRDLADHSSLVIKKLEYTISIMKDAETGQRGYLLTNDAEFLEPYTGSYQKAVRSIDEVQVLTKDNPQMQLAAEKIKYVLLKRLNILQQLIDKKNAGGIITINDLQAGKSAMDSLRAAINEAEADETGLLHTRLNSLQHYTSITPIFLIFATLLSIIISIFSYFRVMNDIAARARLHAALEKKEQETAAMNEELAAANEEIAAANEELAASNEEISAANEEISASNEEISAANEELIDINTQLNKAQENIQELNERLAATNEELSATVDELYGSQNSLQELNNELEERVESRTKELKESESQFGVMMETIPQIAWNSTSNGEITFFNKQWYDYTGLNFERSKGWEWMSVIHPDEVSYTLEKYKSILESGNEGEFEVREKRRDGVYRWHLIRMQPVLNDTGKVRIWVGTATDIQELKNLQQQKDDFISIASHELKTPITTLKVSLQLLDRIKHDPSVQMFPKLIGQANKSLDRVNILVEDLLNVSKLNQGQLHLNKTSFLIHQLVDDCCQHVRIEGAYSIVTSGDLTLQAYADPERIEQVLVNFVNNAIKYAPESKEIAVKIEKQGEMAKVSVSDKGPGIPPEKISHLFERYYRVDNAGIQYSGLGLGLYISSEIIKKHDGQIGVNSEVGKGSTFWFTIPLKDKA